MASPPPTGTTYEVIVTASSPEPIDVETADAVNAALAASHDGSFTLADDATWVNEWEATLTMLRMGNIAVPSQAAIGVLQRTLRAHGQPLAAFTPCHVTVSRIDDPIEDEG